jgi:hypothetical protein
VQKEIRDAFMAWMVVSGFFQYTLWWSITHSPAGLAWQNGASD